MKIIATEFQGLFIFEPQIYKDDRGIFFESYNHRASEKLGIKCEFIQDNQARSARNVIRGLHYQVPPHAQTKLVRALKGSILDVVVDLRTAQPTFRKSFAIELSEENRLQLFIPPGFAHGYSVLSETAEIHYKCDNYYAPKSERGVRFDDHSLAIDWKTKIDSAVISEKDRALPSLDQVELVF